ncbi:MAG: tetratricopeptide repeat protein [Candidatus Sumerlaeaceae bacterium]
MLKGNTRFIPHILALLFCCCWCGNAVAAKETEKKLVIPDYPCAKDQYNFALMYEKAQFMSTVPEQRRQQMIKIAQCYQRVIDSFPQDLEFTSRALLQIGDCHAKISEPYQAIRYYEVVLNSASEDEYLQARALFSVAQMHDAKKEYEAAKHVYKEVMDRYGTSGNAAVRDLTKRASMLYFQVREQPTTKSKWSLRKLFGGNKSS